MFQKDIFKGRVDILIRNVGNDLPKIISFNLSEILNKDIASSKNNQILEKGDLVRVYSNDLFEMQQYVTVEGDINDPGVYQLVKNMTLADLVLLEAVSRMLFTTTGQRLHQLIQKMMI